MKCNPKMPPLVAREPKNKSKLKIISQEETAMKKRILSIALALCMMLTLVPTMAFASDPTYVVAGSTALCEKNWEGSPNGNKENIMKYNGDRT